MVVKKILAVLAINCAVAAAESIQCPNIISRSQWGAKHPMHVNYLIKPLPYVVFHQTPSENCTTLCQCAQSVVNIQSTHMSTKKLNDIGYSFMIGGDGNVYEGTGWIRQGEHTSCYDKRSIGIGFIGYYKDDKVNIAMLDAARKLITCGINEGFLHPKVRVICARQLGENTSPDLGMYKQIQAWKEWVSVP